VQEFATRVLGSQRVAEAMKRKATPAAQALTGPLRLSRNLAVLELRAMEPVPRLPRSLERAQAQRAGDIMASDG